MIDRLRFLLDRPLDPLAARAVVVLATSVLLGFAALFVLGMSEGGRPAASSEQIGRVPAAVSTPDALAIEGDSSGARRAPQRHRQDPQDEKGSPAARRAAGELRSHLALQHVPYRHGSVTVRLVGARRGHALLRVSAPTGAAARRGWGEFLRRFGDDGRSYLPIFKTGGPANE
jgi:hypothetical protein